MCRNVQPSTFRYVLNQCVFAGPISIPRGGRLRKLRLLGRLNIRLPSRNLPGYPSRRCTLRRRRQHLPADQFDVSVRAALSFGRQRMGAEKRRPDRDRPQAAEGPRVRQLVGGHRAGYGGGRADHAHHERDEEDGEEESSTVARAGPREALRGQLAQRAGDLIAGGETLPGGPGGDRDGRTSTGPGAAPEGTTETT